MKQHNVRTEERKPMLPVIKLNSIEAAKAALGHAPFFGGTAPDASAAQSETKEDENSSSGTTTTTSTADTNGAGGDGTGSSLSPEQIAAIVAQNAELAKTTKELSGKLEGYTKQEAEAQKAKMSEVERAQTEIRERDETIMSMDKVIRDMAVQNAIMTSKDLRFHSAKHVINELDPTEYEIDVDLKNGTATVSNLDKALKRIAESNPWMVVDAAKDNPGNGTATRTTNQNPGGSTRRGTGTPPAPGGTRQADAAQRRSDLMKKFPVIARGARTG